MQLNLYKVEYEGSIYELEAPAGTTPEQLQQALAQQQGPQPAAVLKHTAGVSAEDAAEVLRLKKRYPAPFDALYANLKDVKLQEAVEKADERLRTSPKLAEYIGKRPDVAPVLRGDIGVLAELEREAANWWVQAKTGFAEADVQADMADLLYTKATGGSLSAEQEARLTDLRERAKTLSAVPGGDRVPGYVGRAQGYSVRQFMSSLYAQISGAGYGGVAGAALGAPLAGVGAAPGAAAGMIAGGLIGSASYSYRLETAFAYDELSQLRDTYGNPIPEDYARAAAQAVGLVNAVIESSSDLALAALFPGVKKVVGQAFGQTTKQAVMSQVRGALVDPARRSALAAGVQAMLASGAIEGLEEFLQGLVGAGGRELAQALAGGAFAPDSTAEDILGASRDALHAFVGTVGTLGIATGAANTVSVVLANRHHSEVAQTLSNSHRLAEAMKLAGSAKARELAPAEFREVMHGAAQGKSVYVDGEVLAQMPEQVLRALPQTVREEIAVAAETGAAVKLDVADVLTVAPGTPLEEAVIKFGRTSPDAFSRAEVEDQNLMVARLQQETERVIAQAKDAEAARAEFEAVRADYAAQIAATGRYSRVVADGMANFVASFYSVYAARAGITPAQMRARYNLRVVPQATQQVPQPGELADFATGGRETVVEQPAYHGSPHRGIDKFSTAHIGKGEGSQAYGWGLYFAGRKDIAEFYRNSLSSKSPAVLDAIRTALGDAATDEAVVGIRKAAHSSYTPSSIVAWVKRNYKDARVLPDERIAAAVQAGRDAAVGQLYTVEVPDDTDLLEYEATIADQPPRVRAALATLGFSAEEVVVRSKNTGAVLHVAASQADARNYAKAAAEPVYVQRRASTTRGADAYRQLAKRLSSDEAASRALAAAGVPGMRYLDASSRTAQSDGKKYNYVIFTDDAVRKTGELYQEPAEPRGTFNPATFELILNPNADLSTFFHESGHFFLEVLADLAARADAPAQIKADFDAVMKWFGIEGDDTRSPAQTWLSMTLDHKRKYHERFAQSVEQYVMEGKVPNQDLAPIMRRFSAWLKSVYKSVQSFLAGRLDAAQMPLNDDIRRVMDRMLATDEQIAQAEQRAGMVFDEQATAQAQERLRKRSMRDLRWAVKARDKVIAKLKKQAREIERQTREEVTAQVEAMPEYRALAALAEAEKVHEADPVAADFNAAAIADAFGFRSVEAMYSAIERVGDKAAMIEGLTEQRMLEEHGDLVDEDAIKEAANEAVHNEARARALATELRTQQEMLAGRTETGRISNSGARITISTMVEASKRFAAQVLDNTPLADLKATAWKYTIAERQAAARWREATMNGDTVAAVKAKQDQFLNNAAARAATQARAGLREGVDFFRRVLKGNDEALVKAGRDPYLVNAARAILGAYGLRTPTSQRATQYLEVVAQYDPDTAALLQPIVQAALDNAQPLAALTVGQYAELHALVEQLWTLARESRQLEVAGARVDIEAAADELYARMQELGIPDELPGERGAVTAAQRRKAWLLQDFPALLRRVEQWAEAKDGKWGGPFLRLLFQPVKEAADRYRLERAKRREAFVKHITEYKDLFDAKDPIEATEIGYTFGAGEVPAMAELLHALLHTGNTSNKTKLLAGRGWGVYDRQTKTLDTKKWDAFIQRLHDKGVLTKRHWDFVQGVWDQLEEMKPAAQHTHRRVYGRFFAEVSAEPVVTPFGVYRGGYAPAQVDPKLVKEGELKKNIEVENSNASFVFPSTNKGFTMSRVESYTRPLLLDLRAFAGHIDKVVLFTHMQPAVTQTQRLLKHRKVSLGLNRIDGAAINAMLLPWLNRSAHQRVETPMVADAGLNRAAALARSRTGMGLMFLNVSNTLQQVTAFSSALVKVGPGRLARSAVQYLRSPVATTHEVWEKSIAMRDRAKNEVAVLTEVMNDIAFDPSLLERGEAFMRKHAYVLQTAVDSVTGTITWRAAYNQAIEQRLTEHDAIRFADAAVRQTHGSTLPEDVSRFETGPAAARMFTQFMGYFNMLANTNATAVINALREGGVAGAGRAAYATLVVTLIPLWVAQAIAVAMRGGPDDDDEDADLLDDWLVAVFGVGTLTGLTAMVPGLNLLGQVAVGRFTDSPADDRFSLSPTLSIVERAVVGNIQTAAEVFDEDKQVRWQRALRDAAAGLTLLTGLPLLPLARPVGYAAGVAQDKIEPTSPVDAARGLITGTASPDSRVP